MPVLKEEEVILSRGYPSVLRKMPQLKRRERLFDSCQ